MIRVCVHIIPCCVPLDLKRNFLRLEFPFGWIEGSSNYRAPPASSSSNSRIIVTWSRFPPSIQFLIYSARSVGRSLDTVLPAHRITTCEKLMNHFNAIFVGQIRTHGHYNTRFFVELAEKWILLGRDGVKTLSLNGCSILVCYTDPPISGNPRISIKKLSIRYSLYSFPFYLHPTIQPDWIYSPWCAKELHTTRRLQRGGGGARSMLRNWLIINNDLNFCLDQRVTNN